MKLFGLFNLNRREVVRRGLWQVLAAVVTLAPLTGALGQRAEFRQASDPAGIVNGTSFAEVGSVVSTVVAPDGFESFKFVRWEVNGAVILTSTGRAANPAVFALEGAASAVAIYLPEGQDSDADGFPDWREFRLFGDLDESLESDFDGDGFSNAKDFARGYEADVFDEIAVGGVSRRRSRLAEIDWGEFGEPDDDGDGFTLALEELRGYSPAAADTIVEGGVSRRRSMGITVIGSDTHVRVGFVSTPAGIVRSETVAERGVVLAMPSAPETSFGYSFVGWFRGEERLDDPRSGQPASTTVDEAVTFEARYVPTGTDSDGDGIDDAVELYRYSSLEYDLDSDIDGDGLPWRVENRRGYTESGYDEIVSGGVSRRRSRSVVVRPEGMVPYAFTSEPAGIVSQSGWVFPGETVASPNLEGQAVGGFSFAYWTIGGERQTDVAGFSVGQLSLTVEEAVEATAHYFLPGIDDDFDGLEDLFELRAFGTLENDLASDPDGDGFAISEERARGYSVLGEDTIASGGVSRRRGRSLAVNSVNLIVPPYASTSGATQVTSTSVRLNAVVNPAGAATTAYFEYGRSDSFGSTTEVQNLAGSRTPMALAVDIDGLTPGTVYRYRVVAENSEGMSLSEDAVFSTLWDAEFAPEGFETLGAIGRWQTAGDLWAAEVPQAGRGPEQAFGGEKAAGTGFAGNYDPGDAASLVSPLFDVPAASRLPHLQFGHWWELGQGDYALIEIREGTTGIWRPVAAFTGNSEGWSEKAIDLSEFGERRIQVAFRLVADADENTGEGWFIDDVLVTTESIQEWAPNTPELMEPGRFQSQWTTTSPLWQSGVPETGPDGAFEGQTCAGTNLSGAYRGNEDARLVSPFFQMPAASENPRVRFWHWYSFGSGDFGRVEIRPLGGDWTALSSFSGAGGGTWTKPSVDLVAPEGEWVQVAFRFESNRAGAGDGWFIDLAEIVTGPDVLSNPETFDGAIGDWVADAGGLWQIGRPAGGVPEPYSGNNVAGTALGGHYPRDSFARMESPAFEVGDPGFGKFVTLRFRSWQEFGAGDRGAVEISVQDGDVWSEWVSLLDVDANTDGWIETGVDLGAYRNKTVRLSFLMESDGDGSTGRGWYVDDIEVSAVLSGELALGAPIHTEVDGDRQAYYYVLELNAPGVLQLSLGNDGEGNRMEIYASRGALPSRGFHEYKEASGRGANRELFVPWASPGEWYVLVYADTIPTPGSFRLEAARLDLALTGVSPTAHATNTPLSLTLTGAAFQSDVSVELIDGDGAAVEADSVSFDSLSSLTGEFAADRLQPGSYSVRVSRPGGGAAMLRDAVEALPPGMPELRTNLVMPAAIQPGTPATIYLEYENAGDAAMPAPLLRIAAPEGGTQPVLTLDPELRVRNFWAGTNPVPPGSSTEILILASGDQPGVLHPGEKKLVPIYYTGLGGPIIGFSLNLEVRYWTADDPSPIDWAPLRNELRPPTLNAAAWGIVFTNLTADLETTGDYLAMLNDNASYLGRLGQRVIDVTELWNFELQQAYGYSPLPVIDSTTDASVIAPGVPLSIGRQFSSAIRSRWEVGPFGRGWFTPWQTRLVSESGGAVVRIIGEGGSGRLYVRDGRDGSYSSGAGDSSRLSVAGGGSFTLREPDGSVTRFTSFGRIGVVEDANGNRVNASYEGGLLTRLAHTSGGFIDITYDGSGKIVEIEESTGRSMTYEYEGDYLVSATTDDGKETSYSYATSGAAARLHALTTVTRQGVERTFTWDERGRLTATAVADGEEALGLGYGSAGAVTVSDAFGSTSLFFDHRGLLAKTVDPLGYVTTAEFNDELRLKRLVLPTGDRRSFTWCSCGSPTSITDELGNTTYLEYDHPLRRLTGLVDANGNLTSYDYDDLGNLISTNFSDGSSAEMGEYTNSGLAQKVVNRRGQKGQIDYMPSGLVYRRVLADGTSTEFTYDARGNLAKVVHLVENGTEGITEFQYSYNTSGDQTTSVRYPTGSSVNYHYEEGRIVRIVDSAGGDTSYSYDGVGRLDKVLDSSGAILAHYYYDAAGRVSKIENGNGTRSVYEYDSSGSILRLFNYLVDGSLSSRFEYTYNSRGKRERMEILDGIWRYSYDANGQLVRANFESGDPNISDQGIRFTYDILGNRLASSANSVESVYSTNNLNQYVRINNNDYEYDLDGNMISDGINSFEYDPRNLLIRVISPDGTTEYEYDAFGNRAAAIRNGVRTEFLLDASGVFGVLAETTGVETEHNVFGLGLVSRYGGEDLPRFFEYDALGSIVGVSDETGHGIHDRVYLPFGSLLASRGESSVPFGFVGRFGVREDSQSRYHMGVRQYDSSHGRFLQADPIGLFGGDINYYRYANNEVTSLIDPIGLWSSLGRLEDLKYIKNVLSGSKRTMDAIETGCDWAIPGALVGGFGGAFVGKQFGSYVGGGLGAFIGAGLGGMMGGFGAVPGAIVGYAFGRVVGGFIGGYFGGKVGTWAGISAGKMLCDDPPSSAAGGSAGRGGAVGARGSTRFIVGIDPNEKLGPGGYGVENWVAAGDPFPYQINFENLGPGSRDADGEPYGTVATAAVQRVTVTDALPASLDWSGFRLTEFGFGDVVIPVEEDTTHYAGSVTVEIDGNSFDVEVDGGIDFNTGVVTVVFQSIDPDTGLPPEAGIGLLPPEDETGRGKGSFSFVIDPADGLEDGTAIRNIAEIRFDTNEVIATNQIDPLDASKGVDPAKEALVTIDGGAPSSAVVGLEVLSNGKDIEVRWSGDDGGGSGVASFDVYASVDGEPYELWLAETPETSGVFDAGFGRRVAFYSVARDYVGHEEGAADEADAATETAEDAYVAWLREWFGDVVDSPELEASVWGVRADPDVDGAVNGLEFIRATSPLLRDRAGVVVVPTEGGSAVFRYSQISAAEHPIEHSVEWSSDLAQWRGDAMVIRDVGEEDGVLVKEAAVSVQGLREVYFRRVVRGR